jgi:uncharacterized protein YciI
MPPSNDIERAHLAHLTDLTTEGRLAASGLFASQDRGFMILISESRQEAETIVRGDPLIAYNYYKSFHVDEILSPNRDER